MNCQPRRNGRVRSTPWLERPVRDSQTVLDVRARRDTVVAYETTNAILRLLRTRRLLCSHLRRVENIKTSRIGRCQSAANAARSSGARPALSLADGRCWTTHNSSVPRGNLDAPSKRLKTRKSSHRARESEARMKFQCENCGHMNDVAVQQTIAARARWAAKSKAERSAEMSRIRNKGIKQSKRVARRSNDKLRHGANNP